MSEAPRRWLEDDAAPTELVADLRAMRDAPAPDLDYAAGLEALRAKIGGGPGPGTSFGPSAGPAPLGWAGAAGAAVLASLAVLGALWLGAREMQTEAPSAARPGTQQHGSTEARSAPASEGVPSASVDADFRGAAIPSQAPPAPTAADAALLEEVPRATPDAGAAPVARSVRARLDGPLADAGSDGLRREMEQIEEARRALATDPARALALAEAGRREFGRGTFGDERDAIRVLALFALGREQQARPLAIRLLRRRPEGLYADRIRRALGAAEGRARGDHTNEGGVP